MAAPRNTQQLSPEAFARSFKAASRKLWCVAVAVLGDRHHAEDVLQEAALTALGRLESFTPGTGFEAWMAQIVRYCALNQCRRHYRKRECGELELAVAARPVPAGDESPVRGVLDADQGEFDDAVTRALRRLDETARASFLLRTLADLSYREIAALLEIPEGTAMCQVHRARAAMRRMLEQDLTFEMCAAWRGSS
ncbi:MAG: sigma-70 family RNA polymerase sigma factor [Planctomycetes bacterium]|nr:sigma-70 family RNA polymerase sigma factor [Planctomycetota bacterium]MCB9889616.1 sigma-70 family RNA polymerase sigma factor [Planctomycetota bacterium]